MLNFCPKCGNKLFGDRFCPNCGADLTEYGKVDASSDNVTLDEALKELMGLADDKRAESKRMEKERAEAELKNALRFFEHEQNFDGTVTIKKVKDPDLLVGNIVIPQGVTAICRHAFDGCNKIINIELPESLLFIDNYAFVNCDRLTSITIPESVTSIGDSAFRGCTGLISVTIHEGVTSVDNFAFEGCTGLTSIIIPKSVTSIGFAFDKCGNLENVYYNGTLADWCKMNGLWNVNTVAKRIYVDGNELAGKIVMPDGIKTIPHGAFSERSLTAVEIPRSVTEIGDEAFYSCKNLTNVIIPDGVCRIGEYAFARCDSLKNVSIPQNCTYSSTGWRNSFPDDCVVTKRQG